MDGEAHGGAHGMASGSPGSGTVLPPWHLIGAGVASGSQLERYSNITMAEVGPLQTDHLCCFLFPLLLEQPSLSHRLLSATFNPLLYTGEPALALLLCMLHRCNMPSVRLLRLLLGAG